MSDAHDHEPDHVPRHLLEDLVARPDAPEHEGPRSHLAGCESCRARRQALEAERARFAAGRDARSFAAAAAERARKLPASVPPPAPVRARAPVWPRAALALGACALAAGLLLGWLPRPSEPDPNAVRLKGGARLELFVKRGSAAVPLRDGAALAPGDRVGFVYSLPAPRHLLLLGIDDTGAITRYFPADGHASAALPAGARVQLPVAVELDQHRGQERIVALFSTEPLDETNARVALLSAYPHRSGSALLLTEPPRIDLPAELSGAWFRK